MIYKIKLTLVSLVLALTFAINSAEAKLCDRHPKICHAGHVIKEDAKKAWKVTKKVCNEVLVPLQVLVTIGSAIALGLI